MSNKYYGNELNYLAKVLNSKQWSSTEGSWTNTLENNFAKEFNAKYAIAMNSGTAALHAALVACDVRVGDEVITPALTVFMDTSSIMHCGAIPVYADINPYTFNIDPEDVLKKITSKTKAIIAVSLYGRPFEYEKLMKIANEYDLYLIADNAQHTGKHCGHITTYSFENSKHLSCGEGGIAITNSEELALRMRKLSNHGFRNSTAGEGRTKLNLDDFQNPYYERHSVVGWNYRMSEFSAAIVVAQLENIKKLVESRIYSAQQFINVINNTNCNWLIPQEYHLEHSYWTFTVKYVGKIPWADFRKSYINNEGDGAYGAWKVPYLEPAIQKRTFVKLNPYIYENVSYKQGLCPVAETIQVTLMQFKTNYWDLEIADKKAKSLEKTIRGI